MTSDSTSKNGNPISIRRAFDFAWPVYKEHSGLFAAVLLTMFGAWVVLEIVVITGQRFGIVLWVAAHLAFLVFFAGLELGLLHICFVMLDGGNPQFNDTFQHVAMGPKFLAGQIIYLLVAGVGLVLFIFPGVYFGVRYSLFGFCMANGETNLKRCFQQSAILSTKSLKYLLGILAFLLGLNVLGACLLGFGLFVTIPLSILMMTTVYRKLSLS